MEFNIDKCQSPTGCVNRVECLLERNCVYENFSYGGIISTKGEEEIHHFKSGASSSGNKPPYECLTLTLLTRAAKRMEKGMHYGKHNWKKGAIDKAFILDRLNHALEHLVKAQQEIDNDTPMTDDDLAAVVVNCMFAMEFQISKIPQKKEP